MQTRSTNQKSKFERPEPSDLIINSKSGRLYAYEDFKAIHDMCWALVSFDLAWRDAADILIGFRILVVDKK